MHHVDFYFVIIISQDPPDCREDLCDSNGGDCCAPWDEHAACRDDNGQQYSAWYTGYNCDGGWSTDGDKGMYTCCRNEWWNNYGMGAMDNSPAYYD